MTLPTINKKQLQGAVFTLEMKGPMATFTALCQAVANTEFGRRNNLVPDVVAHLLFEHGIICKTVMPDPSELPSLGPKKVVDTSKTLPKVVDTSATSPKVSPAEVVKDLGAEAAVEDLDFLYDEPPAPPPKPKVEQKPAAVEPKKRGRKPKEPECDSCCLDATTRPVPNDRLLKIAYPAGLCPVKLVDLDPISVLDWTERVRSAGVKQGRWYLESALRHFARESFDINGPQWPEVCDLIREACSNSGG